MPVWKCYGLMSSFTFVSLSCSEIRGSGSGTAHLIPRLSPSRVYTWVLFIPAFQIHVIETVWSLQVKGADLMKSHVPSTSNFVTSCWTTELSPLREIDHPWTSWVFRIVRVVLQLFCFSFASGELCDEVINHCVPDLNPCQHESKCVSLDKGTR